MYLEDVEEFNLNNITAKNNTSLEGGSIYLKDIYSSQNNNNKYVIKNSIFEFNEARAFGGAIMAENSDFMLENTRINNNKALIGGGIRFTDRIPEFYKNF